jgi:hypothetical protein
MWWVFLLLIIVLILIVIMQSQQQTPLQKPRPNTITNPAKVQSIKSLLRNTVKRADGSVKSQLDILIDELLSITPHRTEQEYLSLVIGEWHQIWADGPTGPPIDLGGVSAHTVPDQIYQVVYEGGYFWNLTKNIVNGRVTTGYLRGECMLQGKDNPLRIRFTQLTGTTLFPFPGTPLRRLTDQAEDGLFDAGNMDGYLVSDTGTMANIYVDEDFRIVRGTIPGYPSQTFLYLLNRKQTIAYDGEDN